MSNADIAVGACGTGSWERCTMGLPTIGIITADNQKALAGALRKAGAMELLGTWSETQEAELETAITSLLNNPEKRHAMSAAAASICDGAGAFRLSTLMDSMNRRRVLHG